MIITPQEKSMSTVVYVDFKGNKFLTKLAALNSNRYYALHQLLKDEKFTDTDKLIKFLLDNKLSLFKIFNEDDE